MNKTLELRIFERNRIHVISKNSKREVPLYVSTEQNPQMSILVVVELIKEEMEFLRNAELKWETAKAGLHEN